MEALELEIERGPAAGQRMSLAGEWTIGSGEAGPGALGGDRWLSREHARVHRMPEGWAIEDLRSADGTRVNGEPLRAPRLLQSKDSIELGSTRMVVLPESVSSLGELPEARESRDAEYLRTESRRSLDCRRFLAYIVDSLFLLPVYLLNRGHGTAVGILVAAAIGLTYFFLCESLCGQTLGKALFGLRVVRADGRPLGAQAVSGRTVLRVVDQQLAGLVGMLTMVLTRGRRQRLGDLAVGTVVTRSLVPFKREPFAGRNRLALLGYPLLWLAPAAIVFAFAPAPKPPDCATSGISTTSGDEGTCVYGDGVQRLHVVNAGHTLHLPGLDADVVAGRIQMARRAPLVVLQVALTNRGRTPISFDRIKGTRLDLDLVMPPGNDTPVSPVKSKLSEIEPGDRETIWVRFAIRAAALPWVTAPGSGLSVSPGGSWDGGRIRLGKGATDEGDAIVAQLRR